MKFAYFVHDLTDPAVARRVRMLRVGGADPVVIGFRREDAAPEEVAITDTVHRNVLAVPIDALLALASGGYAVAVEEGGTRSLTAVAPGIFDGNRVEVSSSRLWAGMRVEVPSS